MKNITYARCLPNGKVLAVGSTYVESIEVIKPQHDGEFVREIDSYVEPDAVYWDNGLQRIPPKPDGHQVFDYTTKQWIDPRTLADFKAEKWAEIKKARDNAEYSGFTWDGSPFDSDLVSQQKIMGAVQLAGLNPSFTVDWTLADNTVRTLSASEMTAVGVALGTHVETQYVIARGLRDQIAAAQTIAEVDAIVWPIPPQ